MLNFKKFQKLATNNFILYLSKTFSKEIVNKKLAVNKPIKKTIEGNTTNNRNNLKNTNNKVEKVKKPKEKIELNVFENFGKNLDSNKSIEDPSIPKEVYACVYYKHKLGQELNLFNLRNIFYSYLFVKKRNGKLLLNISDLNYEVK